MVVKTFANNSGFLYCSSVRPAFVIFAIWIVATNARARVYFAKCPPINMSPFYSERHLHLD